MQSFSFNPPINIVEEGKWFLGVSSFECTYSLFNVTDGNNRFFVSIPGHWSSEDGEELINEFFKLIDLRYENEIDLRVEQVRKTGILSINDYTLSSLGTFKIEGLEELKKSKDNDLEDVVYRYQVTHNEIIDILDLKFIPTTTIGYTLPTGMYETIDSNLMLTSLPLGGVKLNITVGEFRLRSNLTTNKTFMFTQKNLYSTKI